MKKALLIASVFVIMFISGCVTSTPSGNGVVIKFFESYPQQVFVTEITNLKVKIRNTGSVDSLQGKITISGLDWEPIDPKDCEFKRLLAPNQEVGTEGESKDCSFSYKAPEEIAQGLSVTYYPRARLFYQYRSDVIKGITLISQSELRRVENLGTSLPSETVSSTKSPISISIETKGPIRFWENLNKVTFPLEITLINAGDGVACESYEECENDEKWNRVKVKIEKTEDMELEDCEEEQTVYLWKGKSSSIVCKTTLTNLDFEGAIQKLIKVHADYGYFVDKTTNIIVNWREL